MISVFETVNIVENGFPAGSGDNIAAINYLQTKAPCSLDFGNKKNPERGFYWEGAV